MSKSSICQFEGCEAPTVGRGYCRPHYSQARALKIPLPDGTYWEKELCESCHEAPAMTRGLCQRDYARLLRHGDPADEGKRGRPMADCELVRQGLVCEDRVTNHPTKVCRECGAEKPRSEYTTGSAYAHDLLATYCKDCKRILNKARNYNLSVEEVKLYEEMLCELCGAEPATEIDHDWTCCTTGTTCGKCVRGALCGPCNTLLGRVEKGLNTPSRFTLDQALRYLTKE